MFNNYMENQNKRTIQGVTFTKYDIERALENLDKNTFSEDLFDTDKLGKNYNLKSLNGNYYGIKRVFQCIAINFGESISRDVIQPSQVKSAFEALGIIIEKIQSDNTLFINPSVQEYFINKVTEAGCNLKNYENQPEWAIHKNGTRKLVYVPFKNGKDIKLCLPLELDEIIKELPINVTKDIPMGNNGYTYPKEFPVRISFKDCELNQVKHFLDNILVKMNIIPTDNILKNLIIEYKKFKNSEAYDEQYKWDYAIKHKNQFESLDNFENKIAALGNQNFKTFFLQRTGLNHLMKPKNIETFKSNLQNLLDESTDLETRINDFINNLKILLINDNEWNNKDMMPNETDASYFLFTNDYTKYLLFNPRTAFNNYAKKFELHELLDKTNRIKRYIKIQEYCKNILIPKMDEVLNKSHTLLDAQDFIRFVGNIEKGSGDNTNNNTKEDRVMPHNIPLNQILYGPPGTGKTYNTVLKAMSIIDDTEYKDVPNEKYTELKNRFDELKQAGQIEFVTFHQSYSYEEFVEGIKPNFENETLSYKLDDGIFKQICDHAKQVKTTTIKREPVDFANTKVFKMSLGNTLEKEDDIYNYCIENNVVSLGWKNFDFSSCKSSQNFKEHDDTWGATALERFVKWMDIGDIIIISNGNRNFRAIAQVKSDYIYDPNTPISHTHFRKVDWLYVGEDIHYSKINDKLFSQQSIYGYFYTAKKGQPDYNPDLKTDELNKIITGEINKEISKPHVLIIDEINRGDVSKIFGELITLIEEDKRIGNKYQMTTTLPYSKKEFGVPNNLYIIGTMNTADRSIALLDTALRRRFDFEEIMPKPELLNGEIINGINLEQLLKRINERITEKYDRDHQLGHSYLMNVENEKDLERAYKNRILPLLNEYFYNDSKTVSEVLNCDEKELQNNYLEVLNKAQN